MYSIFGCSNNLFLFWSQISISVFTLIIIKIDFTFLEIFTSPRGKTIDFLLLENKNFTISTSSFTPLNHLKYLKREGLSYDEIIKFNGTQEIFKSVSDYIFTNYFYNDNPKNLQKYKIPEGYKSYYKLIIDDIIVNEVFIKQLWKNL